MSAEVGHGVGHTTRLVLGDMHTSGEVFTYIVM